MESSPSTPNRPREDIWSVFSQCEAAATPLTTAEIADELEWGEEPIRRTLTALSEQGTLETRRIEETTRVWWRPDGAERTGHDEFNAFVNAVEDYAIFVLNPDGNVVTWNEGAARIKGYEEADIVGEHFSTFYTDEDVEAGVPERNLETAATTGRVEDEGLRVREDGSRFWANVTITALRDDDGTLQGFTKVTRDMTDRREHEQQLRQQRDLVEQLFETVPVSVFVSTADGEIVRTNQRLLDRLDLDESTPTDYDIESWDAYDADGDPIPLEDRPWRRVAETGDPVFEYQCQVDIPTVGLRWLSINAAPLFDQDGSVERVVVAGEDITGLKARERQLEQRKSELETELSEIFGRITDAFYAMDEDWRFTHVNERAEQWLDFQNQGLVGEYVWDVFDWVADTHLREEYERAMETQEPTSFEFYYPDPLDSWFEIHAYPSETGLSVYFRDVTDRKERERRLEESERQYRTLVEHFPNGAVALIDDALRYQMIGGTPLDAADVTAGSGNGEFVEDVLSAPLDTELVPRYEAALEGESDSFEIELGGQVYQLQTEPIRDDDGEVFAALGMSQDVTDRREYERKLEESNERLEQFAYAASHDLQEPLRMVTSYLQLIESRYGDSLDEDGREFIEFAVDGAERMREMIDGLLEYSRVETQGDPFEPVELETVLSDVRADLQVQLEESDAEITVESLPRVDGDDAQLRQVVQNLVENAIEYSGDEPPRVRIDAERTDATVTVSVHDEGVGIAPDDTDRIFEVFQRLHTQDEHPGTGIGLALCRRIVERHGGEIWVESEPGVGTTVSFTLPAAGDQ